MGDGEVVLRRREDGARELRVNGVFVMDDAETSSERLLARHVLDLGARDVLVGGLGLGFTTNELLTADVTRVVVAELHPEVVAAVQLPVDPRLRVVIDDVRDVVAAQARHSLDAILLDVDNGPDFLVHEQNAAVYHDDFVATCASRLRDGGHLAIWSMADSEAVRAVLAEHFERVEAVAVPVRLQQRDEHYWVLTGSSPRR